MYLFEQRDKKINVYQALINQEKASLYRQKEMDENISQSDRFFKATTNSKRTLEDVTKDIFMEELYFKHPVSYKSNDLPDVYHFLMRVNNRLDIVPDLLKDYYDGKYADRNAVRIRSCRQSREELLFIKYLLLVNPEYRNSRSSDFGEVRMDNIISIPKSLYLMQMLEQEHFERLEGEDVSEQMEAFTLSKRPVQSFDITDLERMHQVKLISGNMNASTRKIAITTKILQKIK